MIELRYVGRSEDGTSVLFSDEEGQEFKVTATEELRTAVSRVLLTKSGDSAGRSPATPREIQALLREGLSPAEVADSTASPLDRIMRYYAPIAAELRRAVTIAQGTRVGNEIDAPLLGDLVVDRLAARGVDTEELEWSSAKHPDGHWIIRATFLESGIDCEATWEMPIGGGRLEARDALASALTETVAPQSRVHALFPPLSTVTLPKSAPASAQLSPDQGPSTQVEQIPVPPVDSWQVATSATGSTAESDGLASESLVEQLNSLRGKPQRVLEDLDGELDLDDEDPLLDNIASPLPNFEVAPPPAREGPYDNTQGPTAALADLSSQARVPQRSRMAPDPIGPVTAAIQNAARQSARARKAASGQGQTSEVSPSDSARKSIKATGIDQNDSSTISTGDTGNPTLENATAESLDFDASTGARSNEASSSSKKNRRKPVPSWDEIMFGSRPN